MRIGIVGSRSFPQLRLVDYFIRELPQGVTIVSGGASGVDRAAVDYARAAGLQTDEIVPDLSGCKERLDFTRRYYERNQAIADNVGLLVAFTEKDSGGTWDTIKRARKAGLPVKIIRPSLFFSGDSDMLEQSAQRTETPDSVESDIPANAKGKGPFALKDVSLGSYGLRLKRYIDPVEWADFIIGKEQNPKALAEKIAQGMIDFFRRNSRFGCLDAIAPAPRSKRNLDRQHVMDIVCDLVAEEIGTSSMRLFEPWEKSGRGRFAQHGEITVRPEVQELIGRVIWIIDDVCTTRRTLKASVAALTALEIHAHGLAYIIMA